MQGLRRATERLDRAAVELARPDADVVGAVVDTLAATEDFRANAAVLRTAIRTAGALLDVLA